MSMKEIDPRNIDVFALERQAQKMRAEAIRDSFIALKTWLGDCVAHLPLGGRKTA